MVDSPQALARVFRYAIVSHDAETLARVTEAYGLVRDTLRRELSTLLARIEQERAAGIAITRGWLAREDRLRGLLTQTQGALDSFGRDVSLRVTAAQSGAAALAQEAAREVAASVTGTWNRLPQAALQSLVGVMGDGSPTGEYLRSVTGEGFTRVKAALIEGVALGRSPRRVAVDVEAAAGVTRSRALTIARTETFRAYRSASLQTYRENNDVVGKWRWLASLSGGTCPVCISMHGSLHDLDEPFGSHTNCRCVPSPVSEGRLDSPFESGEQWLTRQAEDVQDRVFRSQGTEAADAWRRGDVRLADFVKTTYDPKWGLTRTVRGFGAVLSADSRKPATSATGTGVGVGIKTAKSVTPEGHKVSGVFQLPADDTYGKLKSALSAIDSVHGIRAAFGDKIPITFASGIPGRGQFVANPQEGFVLKISPRTMPGERGEILVHEVGHLLDATINQMSGYSSESSEIWKDWRQAVSESASVKALEGMLAESAKPDPKSDRFIKYLLMKHEIFARSYCQYVALRSGDADLSGFIAAEPLRVAITGYNELWTEQDFRPIADAMDAGFEILKWLKKKNTTKP